MTMYCPAIGVDTELGKQRGQPHFHSKMRRTLQETRT